MILKRILLGVGVVILLLVVIEAVALLRMRASLTSYAMYWKSVPKSGQFTYVALGDSAAQGIGASKPQYGYVGLLAARIQAQTGKTVRIINLSVSGATIQDVINKQLPELAHYKPDLVTIEIGANDVAGVYNAATFTTQYNQLAAQLPKTTVLGNMPYFGGRIRHNAQALDANMQIASVAKKYGLPVADIQTLTHQRDSIRMYAPDLFHPSDRGYQNWADAFWTIIQPKL